MTPAINVVPSPGPETLGRGPEARSRLLYQPEVALASGRLVGFETSPERTGVGGHGATRRDLIQSAEDNGEAPALVVGVLAEACSQAVKWSPTLGVTVDCSGFNLKRDDVLLAAAAALGQSGLAPGRLTVEVNATTMSDDHVGGRAVSRIGIQVVPGDIGSGRVAVSSSPRYRIETLRIHDSLVASLGAADGPDRRIVESIVEVSRALGIKTVADGVANAVQVGALHDLGVGVARGVFFSPPLTSAEADLFSAMRPLPSFDLGMPPAPVELFSDTRLLSQPAATQPRPVLSAAGRAASGADTIPVGEGAGTAVGPSEVRIRQVAETLLELLRVVERQNELIQSWLRVAPARLRTP